MDEFVWPSAECRSVFAGGTSAADAWEAVGLAVPASRSTWKVRRGRAFGRKSGIQGVHRNRAVGARHRKLEGWGLLWPTLRTRRADRSTDRFPGAARDCAAISRLFAECAARGATGSSSRRRRELTGASTGAASTEPVPASPRVLGGGSDPPQPCHERGDHSPVTTKAAAGRAMHGSAVRICGR